MCQSRVEIEDYSVAYFDCTAAFKEPYRWSYSKGGAHTCFVALLMFIGRCGSLIVHASTKHLWVPPSTKVQRYSASIAVMQLKTME